jgi:hypothetical protein
LGNTNPIQSKKKRNEKLIMFRKTMSNVVLRRIATAVTALALSLSGLVFSPVQAAVPVDGDYSCATGLKDGGSGVGYYKITNGVVNDGGYFGTGKCTGAVVIPDGVTSIGLDAFLWSEEITSVNIPSSVTSIEQSAFQRNLKLTSITIPANVTSIGIRAFWDAQLLETVTFAPGSKLESIGEEAFMHTKKLKSIKFPASLTSIGTKAFEDAPLLTDVVFEGNAPASVGIDAFKDLPSSARALIQSGATGFTTSGSPARWNRLEVVDPAAIAAAEAAAAAAAEQARIAAAAAAEQARVAEQARITAAAAAAELASRTISAKKKYSLRSLANQTGIKIVSPKAKVTTTVAGTSKKVCTKSGSTLKTLVAGNCVVTYTIQEPKQTIKTFKSFVVGEVGSGSALSAKSNYSMNAIASANGISRSAKGKLSMTVAKSSKGICSKSGSKLKMLKAGTCNVTFTVNEPQPKATKTTKTFVLK